MNNTRYINIFYFHNDKLYSYVRQRASLEAERSALFRLGYAFVKYEDAPSAKRETGPRVVIG